MAESIVSDWINDFNALEPEELKSFAALHTENHELSTAIHTVLNDRSKHTEVSKIITIIIIIILITSYNTFSFFIQSVINSSTSIDRMKMHSNALHCSSFRP